MQLRDEFLKLLNQGHQTQTKLFQTAQQKGWYQVEPAPASKVQEGIKLLLNAVDQGILDATYGLLDAKTLTAGALTVAALRSKTKYGWAAPGAMTLLWWASKLFGAQSNE